MKLGIRDIKSTITLNKDYNNISIMSSSQSKDNINISIYSIQNTSVSLLIKTIIKIHRSFRKFKNNYKNNFNRSYNNYYVSNDNKNIDVDKFINSQKKLYNNMSKNDIEKCAFNNYFNFSILYDNNKSIEILLCCYEDFKMWINGLAFIIKNKDKI